MPLLHNNEKLKYRRRELRQKSTKEENILWEKIRGSKLSCKFKRQHSIGGYILDFYCSECKLIIEIDENSHLIAEAIEYDNVRDKYFYELSYTTIRFLNSEINTDLKSVLDKIKSFLNLSSPLQGEVR